MTVKFGFYDSLNGDRLYNANDVSTMFEGVFSDGVFENVGGGLQVENNPGSMSVLVNDGRAWFNNTWIRNTSTLVVNLTSSHLVLDRIDLVILEFDSTITIRENSIKVLTGTPSATPIPPVLANTSTLKQYALAQVYVPASSSEILIGDIIDKRGSLGTPYASSLLTLPGITDHGELTGLSDDDHIQYYNQVRGDLRYIQIGAVKTAQQINQTHGNNAQIPASTTYFMNPVSFGLGASLSQALTSVPVTLSNPYVKTNGAQPASGNLVVTLLKNGVATSLVVTIPAGAAAGVFTNAINSVTLVGGDVYGWQFQNLATALSAQIIPCALLLTF